MPRPRVPFGPYQAKPKPPRSIPKTCRHNHPMTYANTIITTRGYFECRTCHNARCREYARRRRANQPQTNQTNP